LPGRIGSSLWRVWPRSWGLRWRRSKVAGLAPAGPPWASLSGVFFSGVTNEAGIEAADPIYSESLPLCNAVAACVLQCDSPTSAAVGGPPLANASRAVAHQYPGCSCRVEPHVDDGGCWAWWHEADHRCRASVEGTALPQPLTEKRLGKSTRPRQQTTHCGGA